MNLVIKKARAKDENALAGVLTSGVEFKLTRNDDSWGSEPFNSRETRYLIDTGNTYCAWHKNEMVGTITLTWADDVMWGDTPGSAGYIHKLVVKSGWNNKGIGEKMIEWSADKTAKNGCVALRLDCSDDNQKLCSYYERVGFKKVATKQWPSGVKSALFELTI